MIYISNYSSPIGEITLASDRDNLIGLWIEGQKYFAGSIAKEEVTEKENLEVFAKTKEWLNEYFTGKNPSIAQLSLAPGGSEFKKAVLDILCEIPYGETMTYGEIAKKTAEKTGKESMSSQAVGGAVGHNPISIIIPCHRVVGSNGSLTGYAGGIDKKIKLLEIEGVDLKGFFVPSKGTAI